MGFFSYFFVMIKKLNRDISHDSEDMIHDSEDMDSLLKIDGLFMNLNDFE